MDKYEKNQEFILYSIIPVEYQANVLYQCQPQKLRNLLHGNNRLKPRKKNEYLDQIKS